MTVASNPENVLDALVLNKMLIVPLSIGYSVVTIIMNALHNYLQNIFCIYTSAYNLPCSS